MVFNMAN
jgi:26S proteasome regulatory subunit T4